MGRTTKNKKNKDGRHVGLDFYDLLIEGYFVIGWTSDGESVYVIPPRQGAIALRSATVSRVNIHTGKMEPWKTLGEATSAGVSSVGRLQISADGNAYAYLYVRVLSEAYVVRGLK